jgi:hypothetical protein
VCLDTARRGNVKRVVVVRNGQAFGEQVNDGPGGPTVVVPFAALNFGATITCASLAEQGAGESDGLSVTVQTSTGRILESLCAPADFPANCPNGITDITDALPASMSTSRSLSPADLRRLTARPRRPAGAASHNAVEGRGPSAARRSLLW